MIALGNTPVTTFDRRDFYEGLLYVMAYYYALHLTYPKCISTLLSVLQTEILLDSIHDQDLTPSYKKALGEWKSFIEWILFSESVKLFENVYLCTHFWTQCKPAAGLLLFLILLNAAVFVCFFDASN